MQMNSAAQISPSIISLFLVKNNFLTNFGLIIILKLRVLKNIS